MSASRGAVKKKVREFRPNDVDDVIAILDRYDEPSSGDKFRATVQLAALKPSDGCREALQKYVELANRDYRDLTARAEYPLQMRARHLARPNLSTEQQRDFIAIRMQDREHYLKWLRSEL